jgi:hypothetical protein
MKTPLTGLLVSGFFDGQLTDTKALILLTGFDHCSILGDQALGYPLIG